MVKKLLFVVICVFLASPAFAERIAGNPQGNVTLQEFFDYQCPHCRNMTNAVEGLIKKNPNLRVVYYVLPLLSPDSLFEAKAALAAEYQGKAANFHQLLMYQNDSSSPEEVLSLAKQDGLNIEQLKADMQKPAIVEELRKNLRLAKSLEVQGVPTFLVGVTNDKPKYRFDGEVSASELQRAINKIK